MYRHLPKDKKELRSMIEHVMSQRYKTKLHKEQLEQIVVAFTATLKARDTIMAMETRTKRSALKVFSGLLLWFGEQLQTDALNIKE